MTKKTDITILKSRLSNSGGLEKYALRTAQAFASKGMSVTILTTDCDKTEIPTTNNIEIVDLGSTSSISFWHMKQFDKMCDHWISTHYPQIIIGMDRNIHQTHYRAGNGVHAAYLQQRSSIEGKIKHFSFKINPLHRLILDIEKLAFESPRLTTLFTNSHMVKREILKYYRTPEEKIQIIHNGVEWHEIQPHFDAWQSEKPLTCEKLHLDPQLFQLLFIGKGYRRKGLPYLIEALASMKERNFQLSVVGKDKEENYFRQMVADSQLEHHVKFFGPRSDVLRFYQYADALVIPSTYDPFANVTVEALAMGLFVVSSHYNGGSEILNKGNGTIIQDLFDRDSIIAALNVAFQHRKDQASAAAIRQSVSHLDFSQQMEKFIRIVLD